MSSLVSEFLINPVLRQARRFSEISRSTFTGDGGDSTEHADAVSDSGHPDSPVSAPVPVPLPVPEPAPVPIIESPLTRPLSVSTQETRVEEPEPVPIMSQETPPRDHIGIALSPLSSRRIPEDDGMRELRSRIHSINAQDIPQNDKARLIHDILLEGYKSSKTVPLVKKILESGEGLDVPLSQSPSSPVSRPLKFWQNQPDEEIFILSEEDKAPTYVPVKPPKRHGSETPVEPLEVVPETEQPLGCQHYERNVKLQCFTCMGLGRDFFHCKTCRACISTSIEGSHKCIERSTDCDCPICGEYLFTSPRPVVFMACGHSIHKKCYEQHMKVSYKCPICNKSLTNMESQFRNLDVAIQTQPMPPEFRDTTAVILCNDCSGKSTVRYHWLGLKCSICRSYNTVELNIVGGDRTGSQPPAEMQPIVETGRDASGSVSGNRAPITVGNRRRHSSHGVEAQYRAPDRVARSVSPGNLGFDSIMAHLPPDEESEDDILGIWRIRNRGNNASENDEDSELDDLSDTLSDAEEEDDDDDEEDENEIVLIGHR
ncbi:Putative RING finger protein C2F3.16 [Fusarium odoratissimum]|uniref:Putative RING finger protein C2F3.16 n=2 Tax=Fusarium oxysporum species complex TaxID=171631 RepID=N1RJM1_FUSC4|nr:Putative RING finger protein C2F3.16 [Fusarium odoratissimum]ENH72535.1 Putative RING finger protein C2F3.16 [Fusarium oxysporum f. sp. cubense race 1]